MAKNFTIIVLFFVGVIASETTIADPRKARPLRDGFAVAGFDGKLVAPEANDIWSFRFDSDLSDGKGLIPAGTALELLPSTTLEKMSADSQRHRDASYRLWGRLTRYDGKNYIFGEYFLAVSKVEQAGAPASQQKDKLAINEPNDPLAMPEEIVKGLMSRQIIRTEQLQTPLRLEQDSVLIDRVGRVRESVRGPRFVLDALGRNIGQISFPLLPCQALETAQRQQSAEPEPLRFRVAGIVSNYKGRHYLLLRRATRVYSHGNFGR